ncbi:MAG: hypothetical protein DHS80DRAFT_22366 [Piptocephalis tieghemiana]|nr:MAG: hypothetical protein DHS80DRAFT_22366 [Piptocephalis tieghemiana]
MIPSNAPPVESATDRAVDATISTASNATADTVSSSSSSSLVDRLGLAKDWKTMAMVVGSVVAAGLGIWILTASPTEKRRPSGRSRGKTSGKRSGRSQGKTSGTGSTASSSGTSTPTRPASGKPTVGKGQEEPLLEEVEDPVVALLSYTTQQIEALPKKTREEHAQALKVRGNSFFQAKNFAPAIEAYSAASRFNPNSAIFHANRAACYAAQARHMECIEACNAALQRDPDYVKALNRRGLAYEKIGELEKSINDLTAACVLENFKNQTANKGMERVLQSIASTGAVERMKSKPKVLPTGHVLKTYMESFRRSRRDAEYPDALEDEAPIPADDAPGQEHYAEAERRMRQGDFVRAEAAYERALEQGCEDRAAAVRSLIMRGTFRFVRGDGVGAAKAFEEAVKREEEGGEGDEASKERMVEAMVKRACLLVEASNVAGAMELFAKAEALNPEDADLYYHRGQVHFILQQLDEAIQDYRKAIHLDPTSVVARIQLGVAQYRQEKKEHALRTFRCSIRDNPTSVYARINFSELLIDQGDFDEAAKVLEEARELDASSGLAWVNEALLRMQWKQDLAGMEEALHKAIEVDPGCDMAYVHLAQLRMQKDDLPGAAELFESVAGLARTQEEMAQALQYLYACKAQIAFAASHPEHAENLRKMGGMPM